MARSDAAPAADSFDAKQEIEKWATKTSELETLISSLKASIDQLPRGEPEAASLREELKTAQASLRTAEERLSKAEEKLAALQSPPPPPAPPPPPPPGSGEHTPRDPAGTQTKGKGPGGRSKTQGGMDWI